MFCVVENFSLTFLSGVSYYYFVASQFWIWWDIFTRSPAGGAFAKEAEVLKHTVQSKGRGN